MKKIQLSLMCISVALLLFSCGGKGDTSTSADNKVSQQDPKSFYDNILSSVDSCRNAYESFDQAIASNDKTKLDASYNTMVKAFDEEKKKLVQLETVKGSNEEQTLGQNFKNAAIKLVDVYVEGAKNEILIVKNLAVDGKSSFDSEILNVQIPFLEKLDEPKKGYFKFEKEFKQKFKIETTYD